MKAKAWRLYGASDLRLEDVELESAGEDGVEHFTPVHPKMISFGDPGTFYMGFGLVHPNTGILHSDVDVNASAEVIEKVPQGAARGVVVPVPAMARPYARITWKRTAKKSLTRHVLAFSPVKIARLLQFLNRWRHTQSPAPWSLRAVVS